VTFAIFLAKRLMKALSKRLSWYLVFCPMGAGSPEGSAIPARIFLDRPPFLVAGAPPETRREGVRREEEEEEEEREDEGEGAPAGHGRRALCAAIARPAIARHRHAGKEKTR
jgi:hypothetical protein